MSTDKNFSTADNNDPQPPAEKQGASNNPENSQQEPKYTQLYGLEGTDGKISLESQASPEPQGAEGKEEPYQHTPKQFDIDPDTHENLLIAQAIRNVLIIIPALIMLVFLVGGFIATYGIDNTSQTIITILIIIALPYMVHVILQIIAFMWFRKSVKFRWIRGVNIYGLIVAPISEATCVSFMLGMVLAPSSIVGFIAALYEIILGISMIVVMTNSIKKTEQPLEQKQHEQKQHEVSEGAPDESL